MECAFCGKGHGVRDILYAKRWLRCCKNCRKLVRSNTPSVNLSQCCFCGIMLGGAFNGIYILLPNGKPNLSVGYSHGLCKDCGEEVWNRWVVARAKRRNLALTA